MNVLVTGHKGFIGSYVFDYLKTKFENSKIVGLDFPDDIRDFIRFLACDTIKYDVIIHLAAFAALRDSIENPDKFWENNVVKSKALFDYCGRNNIRLLYASSSSVQEWWLNPYAIIK